MYTWPKQARSLYNYMGLREYTRVFSQFSYVCSNLSSSASVTTSPKYKHNLRVDSFLVSGWMSGDSSVAGKVQLTLRTAVHPGVCGSVQLGDVWLPQGSEGPWSRRVRDPSGPLQSSLARFSLSLCRCPSSFAPLVSGKRHLSKFWFSGEL